VTWNSISCTIGRLISFPKSFVISLTSGIIHADPSHAFVLNARFWSRYIYYFERGYDAIQANHLSSVISSISQKLYEDSTHATEAAKKTADAEHVALALTQTHFRNSLGEYRVPSFEISFMKWRYEVRLILPWYLLYPLLVIR